MRCKSSLIFCASLFSAVFASPTWQEVSLSLANKVIPRAATTYTFNAKSSQNLAVYFGRTDATSNTTLQAQCNDTNVDIVILAFVTDIVGGGGYPDVSFGKLCGNRTATMRSAGATGLKSCDDLAPQIAQCQAWGKKVLVGIGGQNGNATFASADDATKGAKMLWNIFGGGGDLNIGLRPFGNVTVDGFDIDNESGNGSFYDDFVKALRTLYSSQSTKSYYISAAPPCYFPDASQPLSMLNLVDFVWPQFYSAPSCNIGSDGFTTSFSSWSARLSGPKLYIGAPAFAAAATNGGYQDPDAFSRTIATARSVANNSNFGGVMLWDGAYAHLTLNEQGRSFVNVTKAALLSKGMTSFGSIRWSVQFGLLLVAVSGANVM